MTGDTFLTHNYAHHMLEIYVHDPLANSSAVII